MKDFDPSAPNIDPDEILIITLRWEHLIMDLVLNFNWIQVWKNNINNFDNCKRVVLLFMHGS